MSRQYTLHASGAETATVTTGAISMPRNVKGFTAVLDVTAQSGTTPTLDVKLQFLDSLSGKWSDFKGGTQAATVAFAQVAAATGTFYLSVWPGLTETANKAFSQVVPSTSFRAVCTIGGTTPSYTFTVSMIPTFG